MGTIKELKGRRKRRFKTGSKEPVIFYFNFLIFACKSKPKLLAGFLFAVCFLLFEF
jgi:hypothetical protein